MDTENEFVDSTSGRPIIVRTSIDALDYNMSLKKRGVCLIFDNENFSEQRGTRKYAQRIGSHVDAVNLKRTFALLGFQVFHYKDLTAKEIRITLKAVANLDHTDSDCFACCVLTHGEYGNLLSADDRYPIDQLFVNFLGKRCPTLVGKPKLYFIQACQGTRLDEGVRVDKFDGLAPTIKLPNYADFLIAQSTLPGFYSFRNTDRGSCFIRALTDTLQEFYLKFDLLTMMTIVSQRVCVYFESNTEDPEQHGMKQVPCLTSMLTRRVFFYPKLTIV